MIFIASYRGSPFLQGCLDSIPSDLSCVVVRNDGYECGCLAWVQQHYQGEEFLFLQDSTVVKDPAWIYRILEDKGNAWGLANETGFGSMYMAKYQMEHFRKLTIPVTKTKMEAVLEEMSVPRNYALLDPTCQTLWPDFNLDNARDDVIFDRPVKVYENEHLIKYKSCWNLAMVQDICTRDQQHRAA